MWFNKQSKYSEVADNELPKLFSSGDQNKVLTEIYKRFGHLMFGTCLKYLSQKEEAENCVMEIFEKLPELLKKHKVEYLKSQMNFNNL